VKKREEKGAGGRARGLNKTHSPIFKTEIFPFPTERVLSRLPDPLNY
jgi:hypothetical protein